MVKELYSRIINIWNQIHGIRFISALLFLSHDFSSVSLRDLFEWLGHACFGILHAFLNLIIFFLFFIIWSWSNHQFILLYLLSYHHFPTFHEAFEVIRARALVAWGVFDVQRSSSSSFRRCSLSLLLLSLCFHLQLSILRNGHNLFITLANERLLSMLFDFSEDAKWICILVQVCVLLLQISQTLNR